MPPGRELSAHEVVAALAKVRSGEPDRIRVHASSVVLRYGEMTVVVRRAGWIIMAPHRWIDELTDEGVPERARMAVERREGEWMREPGPDYQIAAEAFRQRLSGQ